MFKIKLTSAVLLRLLCGALLVAAPAAWWLWTTNAATRTWTGGSINDPNPGLRNNFWTTPSNWSGGTPVAGDDLNFPGSFPQGSLTTFAAGTTFNTITISGGHTMQGNGISLNSGITASNGTIILSTIELIGSQTFNAPAANVGAVIVSPINMNDRALELNGPGGFTLTG